MGLRRTVICYPNSAGKLFNLAVVLHSDADKKEVEKPPPVGRWNESANLKDFRDLSKDFCLSVRNLTELVKGRVRWTIAKTSDLRNWSSRSGRTIVLGDAAHAMSPHAAQGSAIAIEDAAVPAECFPHFDRDVAAAAARAYQSIWRPRGRRIVEIAQDNGGVFMLSDGCEQEARDRRLYAVSVEGEVNLALLGQEVGKRPKATADQGARWPSPKLMMWTNEFDMVSEAKAF